MRLEKSFSPNSIEAYIRDLNILMQFLKEKDENFQLKNVSREDLKEFLHWTAKLGLSARSQARMISGIKGFYKYLLLEDIIDKSPASLLKSPKLGRKLPEVLSVEEIDKMISVIDMSQPNGQRNRAIIEMLYGFQNVLT